jgi:flagellar biosynthesis/type III secretory pathway M-ring protein FliF/YscJ
MVRAVRQLASVVGSLGLLLAAFVGLRPISVEAPHADGGCGPPVVRVVAQEGSSDPNEQAIIDRCEDAAAARLVIGAVAVGVGAVGFLVLRLVARRHEAVLRRRRRAQHQRRAEHAERAAEETRQQAARQAERAARFEEAVARDAALRG